MALGSRNHCVCNGKANYSINILAEPSQCIKNIEEAVYFNYPSITLTVLLIKGITELIKNKLQPV